jgi:hypothetical protein
MLKIVPLGQKHTPSRKLRLVTLTGPTSRQSWYQGEFEGTSVFAKFCNLDEDILHTEFAVYQKLSELQGKYIPFCYGLYQVGNIGFLLLTKNVGTPLANFQSLLKDQRHVIPKTRLKLKQSLTINIFIPLQEVIAKCYLRHPQVWCTTQ